LLYFCQRYFVARHDLVNRIKKASAKRN